MSDRQEHVALLNKAGQYAEVRTLLEDAGTEAQRRYKEIRDDPDLSESAKTSQVASVYVGIMDRVDAGIAELARGVRTTDTDDASRVFGIKGLTGDFASLTIARRDAGDRVAKCETADEVRDLLRRATRTEDEILARACAEWAVSHQHAGIGDEYIKHRPDQEAAMHRLWNAERTEHNASWFETSMLIYSIRPGGFKSDAEVRAAANAR